MNLILEKSALIDDGHKLTMTASEESELCLIFNEFIVTEHADGRIATELRFDGKQLCVLMGGFALSVIDYMGSNYARGLPAY